ncbi:MAG: phospholipase D-like domain-containing protein [Alphaproteobacteria bacterium]|nr:phospholipase D-like domain-containing protein [Alphaproteobacteria bacterium]
MPGKVTRNGRRLIPCPGAGVDFYLASRGYNRGLGKLHHKLMVIDEQVLVIGSFNYTNPANMLNDENIIVMGNLEETRPDSIEKQKKLGKFALQEIDRMINEFGVRLE